MKFLKYIMTNIKKLDIRKVFILYNFNKNHIKIVAYLL